MEAVEDDVEFFPEPVQKKRVINGSCTLAVRFETPEDYLKWKYYTGGRQWEFMVNYPAVMRSTQEFHGTRDVEMISRKIVQLLEMGFDVYSANWKLDEQEIAIETTPVVADEGTV